MGEISNMLRPALDVQQPAPDEPRELAGFLIDFPAPGTEADATQLYLVLRRYCLEPGLLTRHQSLARLAFRKFDMARCVAAYVSLYEAGRRQVLR